MSAGDPSPRSGAFRRRRAVSALAAVALLGAGCGADPPDRAAGAAAAWSVPEPDAGRMEPQVARLLAEARAGVLARKDSAEAWGDLGSLYDAHGLFDSAETCYRHAAELDPSDFRWTYLRAVASDMRGAGADELIALFEAAGRLDPGYAALHARLGEALARHGRNPEARERLERASALAPESATIQRMLGQVSLALGDLATSERHLLRAAELEPRDQSAHSALAQLYMRRGDAPRAEQSAARAAELERINLLDDPVYDRWVFSRAMTPSRALARARIRLRDAEYGAAAHDLEAVLAARGGDADTHALLGEAYAALGRTEEATRQFERALALNENHAARQGLERLRRAER